MDLIGSIHYIENRLNGRRPGQGKEKPVRKNDRSQPAGEDAEREKSDSTAATQDSRLGRKIDTTA